MSEARLGFVHTAATQADAFDALLRERAPEQRATHLVEPALLDQARAGADAADLAAAVQRAMHAVAERGAAVVVCTCSSIGDAAERTPTHGRFVAQRIDRAMANEATAGGGRLLLVAALESALAPVAALLADSAERQGRAIDVEPVFVEGAWSHFEAGRLARYHADVARAIRDRAAAHDGVVLAQASLAPAAASCADLGVPVWSSPGPGLRAALAALG